MLRVKFSVTLKLKIVTILLWCLVNLQEGSNKTFLNLQLRSGSRKVKKSNTSEIVKQKLLASIAEHSDGEEDYFELNEKVRNAKQPRDSIALVKKYENILKGTKKKIINIVGKQSELLKCFRDEDEFFDRIDLSRSTLKLVCINSYTNFHC